MFKVLSYLDLPNVSKLFKLRLIGNMERIFKHISYYDTVFKIEYPQVIDYDLVIYVVDNILEHESYLGHVDSSINSYRAITDLLEKPTLLVTINEINSLWDFDKVKKDNESFLYGMSVLFAKRLEEYLKNINPEKILIIFAPMTSMFEYKCNNILSDIRTVMEKLNHEEKTD